MVFNSVVEDSNNMWLTNLVSVLAVACIISACQSASVPEIENMDGEARNARMGNMNKYWLMTWDHVEAREDMEEIANDPAAMTSLTLTGTEKVAIVVHGRESSAHSEFGHTLLSSLINADRDMVVILVDWAYVSTLNYDQAALLVPSIAQDLALFISQMDAANKLDRDQLNLIGFDLGAHVVGIASRTAAARAKKITALSPAGGERFDMYSLRLRASDADFVEVIHTDAVGNRAYGLSEGIGALDFFPNGGTRQPGCANSNNWCHHNRAWQLFAATVDMGGHLVGLRCADMTQVNNNRCVGQPATRLGTLELVKSAIGLYRVNTGNSYPYGA